MGAFHHATRRHDIDFIRVVVFALLMIYHTSLIFGTQKWLINADIHRRCFDLIALASHPWRLSLLFLVSGITTATLARRLSPVDIRILRSRQLIPPLLLGVVVLVPPQVYVAAASNFDLRMSYLHFWLTYLTLGTITDDSGAPYRLVGMQHLWFIAYLWFYTVLLTLWLMRGHGWLKAISLRLAGLLRGPGLFLWPIAYLAALRLTLFPLFGETLEFGSDWYAHFVYFSFFVVGFMIADSDSFWRAVVARRWQGVTIAGLSLALIVVLFLLYPPGERGLAVTILHRLGRSIFQWSAIVAILGICRVTITAANPVISYLNRAMLSYYVLHQTIIVLIAYWLKQAYGLGSLSFVLIVLLTAAVCMLFYEAQRRALRSVRGWSAGRAADQPSTS